MKNTFGAFISSKRLKKSISLRQFADIIKISPEYLSKIENCERPAPSTDILMRMSDKLLLSETELYYLQSRYYDPKIGRFINADDSAYTDTYSGSPLSTNMFAYCENNAISGYDPRGNWDWGAHQTMTLNAGFSSTTKDWVKYADTKFGNKYDYVADKNKTLYCSEPFHSRASSLTIFKNIYNKAVKVKKGKKHVEFEFSNGKKIKDLTKKYFAAKLTKNGNELTTENDMSKNLLKQLNSIKSYKKQSEALLGLALHTIQDYFAHRIEVENVYLQSHGYYYFQAKKLTTTDLSHFYFNHNNDFEDSKTKIPWRFKKAEQITKKLYNAYKHSKEINEIHKESGKKEYYCYYSNKKQCYISFYCRKITLKW